jgi:hypothetical protein
MTADRVLTLLGSCCRKEMDDQTTLLGFVGTPWTLAAYAIEGKADRDCKQTKVCAGVPQEEYTTQQKQQQQQQQQQQQSTRWLHVLAPCRASIRSCERATCRCSG